MINVSFGQQVLAAKDINTQASIYDIKAIMNALVQLDKSLVYSGQDSYSDGVDAAIKGVSKVSDNLPLVGNIFYFPHQYKRDDVTDVLSQFNSIFSNILDIKSEMYNMTA